jgi:hypothetical protein
MKATGDGPGEARLRAADVSDAMTRDREGCTQASVGRLRRSSPAVSRAKRYDSIGSDPAHAGPYRARCSIAGSLSIEPFGPSRWRLRRTRSVSYVLPIVRSHRCAGVRWGGDTPITTVMAPERSVSAARVGIDIKGRTDLGARAYGRDDRRLTGREGGLRCVMEDARQERSEEELPRR